MTRRLILDVALRLAAVRVFFWNSVDLTRKLKAFRAYYNEFRIHRSLAGTTQAQNDGMSSPALVKLQSYVWQQQHNGQSKSQ